MKHVSSRHVSGLTSLLILLITSITLQAQVGIGTVDPKTQLDVDGAISLREGVSLMLTNGNNDDIDLTLGSTEIPYSQYKITDPTAAFNIRSIVPLTGSDGQIVTFINATDFPMTISHDVSATVPNRIFCPGETDLVIPDKYASVTLQYNISQLQWMVVNYAAAVATASSSGDDWSILGNANTFATTNFVGTTNNIALRFRTRNFARFEITAGNVNDGGRLRAFANGTSNSPIYSWNENFTTGMYKPMNNNIGFSTNGTLRFRIPNANQVHAESLGTTAMPFYSFSADSNTGLYSPGSDQLGLSTAGAERTRLTTAAAIFNEPGNNFDFQIESENRANMFYVDASTNRIGIQTNLPSHSFHILNSGNIGVTSLAQSDNLGNSGVALAAYNQGTTNLYNGFEGITAGTFTGVFGLGITEGTGGDGVWGHSNDWQRIGVIGSRFNSGGPDTGFGGLFLSDLGYSGLLFNVSDERLKKNVRNMDSALDLILQLRPVTYDYKIEKYSNMGLSSRLEHGFIAQEVQQIIPTIVEEKSLPTQRVKQIGENSATSGETEKFLMMDYTRIIPILTKALQEQQLLIEAQNKKIEALEMAFQKMKQ